MMATSKSNIEQLNQTLQEVTNELQATIEFEMLKLKERERELQNALKQKTRRSLITTMERELEMGNLSESNLLFTSTFKPSLTTSQTFNQTSKSNLNESIKLSDDSFKKSILVYNKLLDDCSICSADASPDVLQTSKVDAKDFLRYAAQDPTTKNQYFSEQARNEIVRPNMLFARSSKDLNTSLRTQAQIRKILSAPQKDLNKQQTLTYDQKYALKSVYGNFSKSENYGKTKTIQKNDNNNKLRASTSLTRNTLSNSASYPHNFTTLPVTKTLIHDRPWAPGKVETYYYPQTRMLLSKHRN